MIFIYCKLNNKRFSKRITKGLLTEYQKNKYPSKQAKLEMASKFNLTLKQIKNWFDNKKRKKLKIKNNMISK